MKQDMGPRVKRALFWQLVAVVALAFFAYMIFNELLAGYGVESWARFIGAVVLTYITANIMFPLMAFLINLVIFKGDIDAMIEESQQATAALDKNGTIENKKLFKEYTMKMVSKAKQPIGSFMGEDIFEWISFKAADGKTYRAEYEGVFDMQRMDLIPPDLTARLQHDHIMMPPGIIYRVLGVNSSNNNEIFDAK